MFDRTTYRNPFNPSHFQLASSLNVSQAGAEGLEEAFQRTQNIHGSWNPDNPCRSTMVGDVFEVEGTFFLVDAFGFTPLDASNSPAHRAYVIVHPEWGIFLGAALGLAFFSKVETAGQDAAPTFPTREAAETQVKSWEPYDPEYERITYHEIIVTDIRGYASIQDCTNAGLPAWKPEATAAD